MRTDWHRVEGLFIREFLRTLYWLGWIEIGLSDRRIQAFRWTHVGASLMEWTGYRPPTGISKPIIVQPNFEIWLTNAPDILPIRFRLEQFAQRGSGEQLISYYLTRESVQQALQQGLSSQELIQFLEQYSSTPLPQNVLYNLKDWGKQHQRITIQHDAMLIEVENAEEVEALCTFLPENSWERISQKLFLIEGSMRRETLLFLEEQHKDKELSYLDYRLPAGSMFKAHNDGTLTVRRDRLDWLTEQLIESLAERQEENEKFVTYQITEKRIQAAAAQGWDEASILDFLSTHCSTRLPKELCVKIPLWLDTLPPGQIQTTALYTAPNVQVLDTLEKDELFQKIVLARISEQVAVLHPNQEDALHKVLQKHGFTWKTGPAKDITTVPKALPPKDTKSSTKQSRALRPKAFKALVESMKLKKLS